MPKKAASPQAKEPFSQIVGAPRVAWPVNEGCHRLGIGRVSLYALAKRGEIRLIKVAGRTLIPESEIARLTAVPANAEAS